MKKLTLKQEPNSFLVLEYNNFKEAIDYFNK